jgi:exopolysaccharide biosynthesis WecB/TagA/CpsF family protein
MLPAMETIRSTATLAPAAGLACPVDDFDLPRFAAVAAGFGRERYGYVVTPNADHLVRLHEEPRFRRLYADAAFVLLDSRLIAHLLRLLRRQRLPVCTGSDLVATLLGRVVAPDDPVVLVGCGAAQAAQLAQRYGLRNFAHHNPPMGFIDDAAAVETCLRFVEAHSPFRFCLLAVGSPRQEMLAQRLLERGVARGLALCCGASVDFLTGAERRAPQWMQRFGLEWLFRLLQSPRRLGYRYLVRAPRIFGLLGRTRFVLRAAVPRA